MFRLLNLSFFIALTNGFMFNKPIFITGATSKIGVHVINQLEYRNVKTKCLVRNLTKAENIFGKLKYTEFVEGDVLDSDLVSKMQDCSSVICLHGINKFSNPLKKLNFFDLHGKISEKNHPYYVNYISMKNIIYSCKKNNINRILRVTGLATGLPEKTFWPVLLNLLFSNQVKWHVAGENEIVNSGLTYTILRPGAIRNNKNFDNYELKETVMNPPALISSSKIADIIIDAVFSEEDSTNPIKFENSIYACSGKLDA
tara:strand:- start:414 stop:1184 length:771 start_codon:yes stop_codon:yes gene_type:complete